METTQPTETRITTCNSHRLLRIREVSIKTGLPETSVYDAIRSGSFPPPVKIAARSSAWLESEVDRWIDERIATRNAGRGVAA
jgi:prophage regulatory protein